MHGRTRVVVTTAAPFSLCLSMVCMEVQKEVCVQIFCLLILYTRIQKGCCDKVCVFIALSMVFTEVQFGICALVSIINVSLLFLFYMYETVEML